VRSAVRRGDKLLRLRSVSQQIEMGLQPDFRYWHEPHQPDWPDDVRSSG